MLRRNLLAIPEKIKLCAHVLQRKWVGIIFLLENSIFCFRIIISSENPSDINILAYFFSFFSSSVSKLLMISDFYVKKISRWQLYFYFYFVLL